MPPLKSWLKKEDIYDNDLYSVLSSYGIKDCPKDLGKITQSKWDAIWRKCTVEKFKELKDQTSRNRLQKKMKRLESHWRKETGIKMSSLKNHGPKKTKTKRKTASNQSRSKKKNNTSSQTKSAKKNTKSKKTKSQSKGTKKKPAAHDFSLKQFLQKNGCYELELCKELKRKGIHSEADIKNLSERQFDTIVRKVRVERFAQLKDQSARNRCDKVLVTFEKIWRKKSGNKKTNLKNYAR